MEGTVDVLEHYKQIFQDRLVELANICGHVSAQAAQAEKYLDWCGALQALCCSSLQGGTSAYPDLLMEINVNVFKLFYQSV